MKSTAGNLWCECTSIRFVSVIRYIYIYIFTSKCWENTVTVSCCLDNIHTQKRSDTFIRALHCDWHAINQTMRHLAHLIDSIERCCYWCIAFIVARMFLNRHFWRTNYVVALKAGGFFMNSWQEISREFPQHNNRVFWIYNWNEQIPRNNKMFSQKQLTEQIIMNTIDASNHCEREICFSFRMTAFGFIPKQCPASMLVICFKKDRALSLHQWQLIHLGGSEAKMRLHMRNITTGSWPLLDHGALRQWPH